MHTYILYLRHYNLGFREQRDPGTLTLSWPSSLLYTCWSNFGPFCCTMRHLGDTSNSAEPVIIVRQVYQILQFGFNFIFLPSLPSSISKSSAEHLKWVNMVKAVLNLHIIVVRYNSGSSRILNWHYGHRVASLLMCLIFACLSSSAMSYQALFYFH
jgi:hypothetical protein